MYRSLVTKFRQCSAVRNYSTENEGIKYYGFTYYPRFPDHKDPPYEPSKLFMVQRVKPVWGNPYWEKNILKQLGLIGKRSDVVIVKNIPEINAMLWKVKHLIKITPITFPNGLPTEDDCSATYLKENGELTIIPKLTPAPEQITALEDFRTQKSRLDGETLRKYLRNKWINPW